MGLVLEVGFPCGSEVTQELQEMWVQSLDQEDPLEEGMATHFCIFAWRIPWTEEAGGLRYIESHRVRQD